MGTVNRRKSVCKRELNMKYRNIVYVFLLLVLVGAGIWYARPDKNEALRPLEKEELNTESSSALPSRSGQSAMAKSEGMKVPEKFLGDVETTVSPKAVDLEFGSSLIKKGKPNLGTAQFIGGKTILISIFVNNTHYKWNFKDSEDADVYSKLYYRLCTASQWIEEQAADWNVRSDIIWDWYNNDGLFYITEANSNLDGSPDSLYTKIYSWIQTHIDLEKLAARYSADNAIFLFYVNSDPDNEERSFAYQFDYESLADQQIGYEAVWFYTGYADSTLGSSALAHEMLHCFGARDLYYSDDWITDAYVDHLKSIGSQDIMYMVYDEPDVIYEQFSELDAYYVGLTASSSDAVQFGLGQSPHLRR